MSRAINRASRGIASSALVLYLGAHAVEGDTAAEWVDWVLWIFVVGGLFILATEPGLRERRYTLHLGQRGGSFGVWIERPIKPLFARRRVRKDEIELGRRAIQVGRNVHAAYQEACAHWRPYQWSEDEDEYRRAYQDALATLKQQVGPAWAELIQDLESHGVFGDDDPWNPPPGVRRLSPISVNMTGLDGEAIEAQAIGRRLLRKHGVEPED